MQQSLASMRATIAPKAGAAELQRMQPAGTHMSIMFSSVSSLAGKHSASLPLSHLAPVVWISTLSTAQQSCYGPAIAASSALPVCFFVLSPSGPWASPNSDA